MLTICLGLPPINRWSRISRKDFESFVLKEYGNTVKSYSMGEYIYSIAYTIVARYHPNGWQSEGIIYKTFLTNDVQ